jgi:excisionase family DNA binding protein
MSQVADTPEVLTLEEASSLLRVSEDAVLRLVVQQILPGRQIDGQRRFLRAALADWLRQRSGKAALLGQPGVLADDESRAELRAAIYEQRGRPETEGD